MRICRNRDKRLNREDAHEEARLIAAEKETRELKDRAETAIRTLDARSRRNHWQESIKQMIQGV